MSPHEQRVTETSVGVWTHCTCGKWRATADTVSETSAMWALHLARETD